MRLQIAKTLSPAASRCPSDPSANGPARILRIMRSPVFVRYFEAALRELARRGRAVHIAFEGDKQGQAGQRSLIEELAGAHPEKLWAWHRCRPA